MQPAVSEHDRLAALHDLALLDTPPERQLDGIVRDAALAAGAPVAMISLIDDRRQWFKAKLGIERDEDPIEHSICAHAMHADDVFVVGDARADDRFSDIPAVRADGGIRFYAGAPLRMRDGARLGTLCVIDVVPRAALEEEERRALETLARRTVAAFELRREMMVAGEAGAAEPDQAKWLDEAAGMLERAAVALDRADASAPLAHLEQVIALVEAQRMPA